MLDSICTIATSHCLQDLQLMLFSLRQFDQDTPVYLICDQTVLDAVKNQPNLIGQALIPERMLRADFGEAEDFMSLVDRKMYAMELALKNLPSTLFVDSDIIFAEKVCIEGQNYDVLLSPHYIDKHETDKHGFFNAGYLWTKSKDFPKWWRRACKTNKKFLEQGCLEDAERDFNVGIFGPEHNFGWFRVSPWHSVDADIRISELQNRDLVPVTYHTHLDNKEGRFMVLNSFLKQKLNKETLAYAHTIGLI